MSSWCPEENLGPPSAPWSAFYPGNPLGLYIVPLWSSFWRGGCVNGERERIGRVSHLKKTPSTDNLSFTHLRSTYFSKVMERGSIPASWKSCSWIFPQSVDDFMANSWGSWEGRLRAAGGKREVLLLLEHMVSWGQRMCDQNSSQVDV